MNVKRHAKGLSFDFRIRLCYSTALRFERGRTRPSTSIHQRSRGSMKLKEADIHELNQRFEDGLNRLQKVDRKERLRFRRRIRDELFSLLGWELASPAGIIKRFEERLSDLFAQLPYGFKDELSALLTEKMTAEFGTGGKRSEILALRERRQNRRDSETS